MIEELARPAADADVRDLAGLLLDAVASGASVGFLDSLSADEVYAVCAYILTEAKIIDKSTVLDAQTLPRVEMPNRDGFVPDPRPEAFK